MFISLKKCKFFVDHEDYIGNFLKADYLNKFLIGMYFFLIFVQFFMYGNFIHSRHIMI